jgi:hypothetical protein
MGILLLHFFWLVIHSASKGAVQRDTSADLRYVSLMVTFVGVIGALAWEYPPQRPPV